MSSARNLLDSSISSRKLLNIVSRSISSWKLFDLGIIWKKSFIIPDRSGHAREYDRSPDENVIVVNRLDKDSYRNTNKRSCPFLGIEKTPDSYAISEI